MKYKLVENYTKVGDVHLVDTRLYYVKDDTIIKYPNQEVLKLNDYWGIYYGEKLINVFTARSFNTFYDYNGKVIQSFNNVNFYYIFYKDDFIYFDRNDKITKYNSTFLFDRKMETSFVDKNILFFINNGLINSINYSNAKLERQFDLQSIPNNPHNDNYNKDADWEVKKFIGVLENKLWVALNHHTIVALDIETGQLLHQIHHIPSFKSEWLPSAIPLSEATVIDDKGNKLIGFMWEFYWEINPQNGEIALWDLTVDFLAQRIRNDVKDFVLTEHTIYFASHFDSKIGALDRETKKIVWQYEFAKDAGGREPRIIEIQGNDDMLGALSSDKTLYIFERETN